MAVLLLSSTAFTQSQPAATQASDSTPVFRATTRLVQVDVVVTDKDGKPIEGLKREDFTLLQDGKPQAASIFEPHTPQDLPKPEEPAKPHKLNSYSNEPDDATSQSWTVLLFDVLNTPIQDQQVAKAQLNKIAQAIPAGQPVAVFMLASHLYMLQSFTRDPQTLRTAIHVLSPQQSGVITTEKDRQHDFGQATYVAETTRPSAAGANVNQAGIDSFTADMIDREVQRSAQLDATRLDARVAYTLDCFEGLSRALAGYPGRKSLIWLSGTFPIRVLPNNNTKGDKRIMGIDYQQRLSRTVALLAQSRVAVYPIDIRGMQMRGIDMSNSTAENTGFLGGSPALIPSTTPTRTGTLLADQNFSQAQENETANEVADQTGGRAFLNTSDFNHAIARAMEDGASYYTLAYSPGGKVDEKPTYHRIEVRLDRSNVKLSYRRGYYSQPEVNDPQSGLAALKSSLQPGMPPSTMIFFTAAANPPEPGRQTVRIIYNINPGNITLEDGPNGAKHILVDCAAVAFDKDGKQVAGNIGTVAGNVPQTDLAGTLINGIPAALDLQLKPGVYNLRLGVQDRDSQRIGTLSIPVTVPQPSSTGK